jgi:ABC-type nitrate/sulfonate/bicarbonate transport system permease component
MTSRVSTVRRMQGVALPLAMVALVLAAVQGLHAMGRLPIFLPAPSDLWAAFWENPGLIFAAMAPTLGKATVAFAIAAVLALAGAGIAAAFAAAYGPIYNFGATLQAIPVIATAPLFAVWLGTGPSLQVVIAVLSSQFPMLAGAMQGFRAVDAQQRELFHTLSASKLQSFRYLTLPASLSYVFAGFKVAAPAAVLGTITAEWAGAEKGVGALMLNALFSYDPPTVWLSVIAACVLAGGGYAFWAAVERIVVFWEHPSELTE